MLCNVLCTNMTVILCSTFFPLIGPIFWLTWNYFLFFNRLLSCANICTHCNLRFVLEISYVNICFLLQKIAKFCFENIIITEKINIHFCICANVILFYNINLGHLLSCRYMLYHCVVGQWLKTKLSWLLFNSWFIIK